jgi:hypothetical protein
VAQTIGEINISYLKNKGLLEKWNFYSNFRNFNLNKENGLNERDDVLK